MLPKFINGRLNYLKFALKLFYVDAPLLIGDFQSLSSAISIFKELKEFIGKSIWAKEQYTAQIMKSTPKQIKSLEYLFPSRAQWE